MGMQLIHQPREVDVPAQQSLTDLHQTVYIKNPHLYLHHILAVHNQS